MKKKLVLLFFLVSSAVSTSALGPFASFFEKEWATTKSFAQQVEKHIEDLRKRKADVEKSQARYKSTLDVVQKTVSSLKERAQRVRGAELDYVNQYLALSTKIVEVLKELVQVYQEMKGTLEAHIKLLQDYKQDPEFKQKGLVFEQKSIYSIDDFQKMSSLVLQYDNELKALEERLSKIGLDAETLRKNQALARAELEEKKKEQKELKSGSIVEERPERKRLTLKQQGELLDAEERLLGYRKELGDAKIKEAEERAQYIEQSIRIKRLQLETIEKEEEHVRQELKIDRKDVVAAEMALKQQMAESSRLQEDYSKRIESLNLLKQSELAQINQLRQRFQISDGMLEAFYNWTYTPTTIPEWRALIEIGRLHDHIIFEIEVHTQALQAHIEQEKAKVAEQEVSSMIIQSWYNLTTGKFDGYQQEELAKEIKQYEKIKADIQASLGSLADKRTAASNLLNTNLRIAEAIKARLKAFKEQRQTVFKNNLEEFNRLGGLLKEEAFTESQQRGELITQLVELYTSISNYKNLTIKKIDAMLAVLSSKTRWKGAPPLLTGLKKFGPDMGKFVQFLVGDKQVSKSLVRNQQTFVGWLKGFKESPSSLLAALLYAFILFLLYLLFKLYLPDIALMFSNAVPPDFGIVHASMNFIATVLYFIARNLQPLYLWTLLFLAVRYQLVDAYLGAWFYLFSIPFWLYYVQKFISNLRAVNTQRGYLFTSKRYQERFFLVISIFLYATTIILFLREAILFALPKSDAPRVLLALNFILAQLSLILIIGREQILSLIPRTTPLWQWIYEVLNRYYYLFLSAIVFVIVMSNPYIGYGPTFFYAISRLALIALLIPFFIALHGYIKRWSGSFFFYSDEEGIKERFRYGRTSYGLFVICSFLALTSLAIIIAVNIWGYPLGFNEITSWLHEKRYDYTNTSTGRTIDVNLLDIGRVFVYILVGIVLAYLINRFVLRRMFDLLLINPGVQNAFLSLIRYSIIIAAIVIGLQSIGLSYSLIYIFAVLGGLGVAGKEIITDFIGYFVILIQRPIKIGDFVRVDPDLQGVVRHLTLRSIFIRKNNSVTVIIPNSFIMTRPVVNWNYSRTYFAFEDIHLDVAYSTDPFKVKELLLDVLDRNVNLLKNPPPIVRLHSFTDNGFQFMVRGFLSPDKVHDQFDIASDVRLELVRTLRAHGMDIGSPTRVLRLVQEKSQEKSKETPL